MTKLYLADLRALRDSRRFADYYAAAPAFRKEKIDGYRLLEDKVRSLGVLVLLGRAMEENGFATLPDILTDDNGKPYFSESVGMHFSLSHSGIYALCALSDEEVGCDVEKIDNRHIGVAKKYFSPAESAYIRAGKADERFCALWTLKESVCKLTGKGITDMANVIFDCSSGLPTHSMYTLYHGFTSDGYAYACAYQSPPFSAKAILV